MAKADTIDSLHDKVCSCTTMNNNSACGQTQHVGHNIKTVFPAGRCCGGLLNSSIQIARIVSRRWTRTRHGTQIQQHMGSKVPIAPSTHAHGLICESKTQNFGLGGQIEPFDPESDPEL